MRFLLALIVGIVIGAAAVWYYGARNDKSQLESPEKQIQTAAQSARDAVEDKLRSLHLTGSDISNELARTGRVMRREALAAGQAISDATADARVTAVIKAKLLRDSNLSAWNISVNTTGGVVTLSGTVSSVDNIGKAVLLAMETDGVRQVISTLQVKPN
jgi:hyperosmotically inducible protein